MKKPKYHILLCNSYRLTGQAQGACHVKGSAELLPYIVEECSDRGLDVAITTTACMNNCSEGPVMVIHPLNAWYGNVDSEDKIDEILDALEDDNVCVKYLIGQ
jgi:(2Fe-2S) ferredoxin